MGRRSSDQPSADPRRKADALATTNCGIPFAKCSAAEDHENDERPTIKKPGPDVSGPGSTRNAFGLEAEAQSHHYALIVEVITSEVTLVLGFDDGAGA